jgi:undecaprenyl-diphosphatase
MLARPRRIFEFKPPVSPAFRWGSWAAVGLAVLLIAAFIELSEQLPTAKAGSVRLLTVDASVLRFVARFRHPWLNGLAMDLTALGSPIVVGLFTFAFGALLIIAADRQGAIALVASSLTSALLTFIMKSLLERPRPDVVPRLVAVSGLSYPSGHSLASAAVYLTAAFVIARHMTSVGQRVAAVAFSAIVVFLIGASRVYLGVHFPTDVFGGILLGTAWALLMAALVRRLDHA